MTEESRPHPRFFASLQNDIFRQTRFPFTAFLNCIILGLSRQEEFPEAQQGLGDCPSD